MSSNRLIPVLLNDIEHNRLYMRKRFFGKGGFAKCYEILDGRTNLIYACKIIAKKNVIANNLKEKMKQEIVIHRSLKHKNIVGFHSFFEDAANMYIVLELCRNHSLRELQRRRKYISEYETRYYIYQLAQGVKYLHDNRIIHRDIKLANILLDEKLHVKIGDFGLATRVEYVGERKQTICGTPNYIAPEILTKEGHSYEVDIWAIGCVMYTLIVGRPPFEMNTLDGTYKKIKKCDYRIPIFIQKAASNLIVAMLQAKPQNRPKINDLLTFEFLTKEPVPDMLPTTCLTMLPRLCANESIENKKPSKKPKQQEQQSLLIVSKSASKSERDSKWDSSYLKKHLHDTITISAHCKYGLDDCQHDIASLLEQLTKLIESKPQLLANNLGVENTDPAAQPLFWVSKWVDYSDKYGFGYQLCDESIGVMFNDSTKMIFLPNYINVHYVDEHGKETYMTATNYCKSLEKKMKLLFHYKHYMTEYLNKAGVTIAKDGDVISRMPHLQTWFRTKSAVAMHLTNGTVQLNFSDHIKIILCPRMSAVTYMDQENSFHTYRFSTIANQGCSKDLLQRMDYAREKVKKMVKMMK